ncbi:Aldose 1-epimerase [Varanus komodoensis]|nr:Aldose 1-epimerase [Varanus komodoensis]
MQVARQRWAHAFKGEAMTEVKRNNFGEWPHGGGAVEKILLRSDSVKMEVISLGCIITTLETKDRDGKFSDIVLGFDHLEGYINKHPYFGAVVGRVANRIARGKCVIEGQEYQLPINNGPNSLHGGIKGFDKSVQILLDLEYLLLSCGHCSNFSVVREFDQQTVHPFFHVINEKIKQDRPQDRALGDPLVTGRHPDDSPLMVTFCFRARPAARPQSPDLKAKDGVITRIQSSPNLYFIYQLLPIGQGQAIWAPEVLPDGVRFFRASPDLEEGYPGELKVWVTYTLKDGELMINYRAQSSKTTPVNLTNHSYFNLAGQGSPNIYDHEFTIKADAYLPVDETQIPTGEISSVQDTAFDLRKPVKLGQHLQKFQLNGFDHNFCLTQTKEPGFCARAYHPPSGRMMEVYTSQPGIQFYTGNFLDGTLKGKGNHAYLKHSGFCLETQNWPDAVNQPHFPDALLHPGEEYNTTTCYKFSIS